jgi:hypothetical protein
MEYRTLPVRATRVGGAVKRFDEPRIAYKSVATESTGHAVATLLVEPGSRVVYPARPAHSWNSNKLRTERVTVLDIDAPESRAVGPHARSFVYEVGDTSESETFNSDPHSATGGGLYCFATRDGAEHWGREHKARPWDR